jgi:HK97 family phage portal protein
MTQQTWYNAERVAVKGSVVLQKWNAERQAIKALGENASVSGLTPEQFYNQMTSAASFAGPAVTAESSMKVSTVYACVSLVSGAMASMPTRIYKNTPKGREKIEDHPYHVLFNLQPNENISASMMWKHLTTSLMLYGDGFLEILRPSISSNKIKGFKTLHPQRVQPFTNAEGQLLYRITPNASLPNERAKQYILEPADIIHITGHGFNGLRSISPITWAARQNIGIALAAEEYSAKFFSNGATSDIALKTPGKLTSDQADVLRASYAARSTGSDNYHSPIILSGGLEVEVLSINPQDAALIATREFTVEEICRTFLVPPHMVGHTTKDTSRGSGLETKGLEFVKYTLLQIMDEMQQQFTRKCWPVGSEYYIEFDTGFLEKADMKTRYEAHRIALGRAGERPFISVNEVRDKENYLPSEDGDDMSALIQQTSNPDNNLDKAAT